MKNANNCLECTNSNDTLKDLGIDILMKIEMKFSYKQFREFFPHLNSNKLFSVGWIAWVRFIINYDTVVRHQLRNRSEVTLKLFELEIDKIREKHNKLFSLLLNFFSIFSQM
jgi:hypothetical protein